MRDTAEQERPRRVLGFDYGSRRIGIAFGQEASGTARPLRCVDGGTRAVWSEIGALIEEWAPDLFVVGMPLHADGSATSITNAVERFIRRLDGRFGLPVETVDETLSSQEAESRMAGTRASSRAPGVDATAACVIVEDWLQQEAQQS